MNKKAFTLMEMLVAILIIMILAGYAIFAYLDSLYEAEFTQGKAKLELISNGYERFAMEYPSAASSLQRSVAFTTVTGALSCSLSDTSPNMLIHCGYIPKMDFSNTDLKFNYYLGAGCACKDKNNVDQCADGYAYMQAKAGADLGNYSGKCAGISLMQGGKALDGN